MMYIIRKAILVILMWANSIRLDIKYGIMLDIYLLIYKRKFLGDELVMYRGHVWEIYYVQRSYRPYYYYICQIKNPRFMATAVASEDYLRKVPPVMKGML